MRSCSRPQEGASSATLIATHAGGGQHVERTSTPLFQPVSKSLALLSAAPLVRRALSDGRPTPRRTCTYTYIHMYICMYTCTYAHMYICTYAHMYICTYIHMYICTYTQTYTCTYTHTDRGPGVAGRAGRGPAGPRAGAGAAGQLQACVAQGPCQSSLHRANFNG